MATKATKRRDFSAPTITQPRIRNVYILRRNISEAEKALKKQKENLKREEGKLLDDLRKGADVENGTFFARIYIEQRITPPWRRICEERLGAEEVERIISETPANTYERLVIE